MTQRLGLRLLAAVLPATALLLPGAAQAEKVVTVDAPGDARAFTFDQQAQFVPAPQEAAVDITRTVTALGHRRLSVTVRFRDLQVRPRHTTLVRVGTPRRTFDVIAERTSASRATVEVSDRGDTAFECRGLRVGYDGAADLVSLSVPTSCLESPRWVQLGVRATASPEANPENPSTIILFADDGHRGSIRENSIGKGPKVRRG